MILTSDYDTITPGCHQIMTLCCCSCFASSVASWTSWRRVASLCPCPCNTSRHGLRGVTSHHFALALAVPSRHGLRGVASHHFALALLRRSRHGLHRVASHHFAAPIASHHFAATIIFVAMDSDDMRASNFFFLVEAALLWCWCTCLRCCLPSWSLAPSTALL